MGFWQHTNKLAPLSVFQKIAYKTCKQYTILLCNKHLLTLAIFTNMRKFIDKYGSEQLDSVKSRKIKQDMFLLTYTY